MIKYQEPETRNYFLVMKVRYFAFLIRNRFALYFISMLLFPYKLYNAQILSNLLDFKLHYITINHK